MASPQSLQTPGRPVETHFHGTLGLARALALLAIFTCVAVPAGAEPLSPVQVGEAPIFERPSAIGDITYTPGRGLRFGNTGLTVGGFANLAVGWPEGEAWELEFDSLSLLAAYDPLPRLHYFFELNYKDAFEVNDRGDAGSPDDRLTVERLYADVAFSDHLNVRTGIFLTPVGRWNVIHAPPLQWTTEQPLVTELPFDLNLTGVMVFGSFFPEGGLITYSLYDQFADPIEGDPEFEPADHSVGARLEYDADAGWSVGASYLAARRESNWRHLGGLDLLWNLGPVELMGEFAIEDGKGDHSQWGVYLQSAYQLTDRTYLVGRFEHYDFQDPEEPEVNTITLGLGFRPIPAVVLKAEYLIADRRSEEAEAGFHASIATLF